MTLIAATSWTTRLYIFTCKKFCVNYSNAQSDKSTVKDIRILVFEYSDEHRNRRAIKNFTDVFYF